MSHSHAGGDCYCSLNCYKRYDGALKRTKEMPHYPANLKTIYGREYTEKKLAPRLKAFDSILDDGGKATIPSKAWPGSFNSTYHDQFYGKEPKPNDHQYYAKAHQKRHNPGDTLVKQSEYISKYDPKDHYD